MIASVLLTDFVVDCILIVTYSWIGYICVPVLHCKVCNV